MAGPYTIFTPNSRRNLTAKPNPVDQNQTSDVPSCFEECGIASKIWKTYHVSPLHNFKINRSNLLNLSKFIGTYMETARSKDDIAIYRRKFKVNVSVLPQFSDSENDLKTIKIEVFSLSDSHEPCFTAFLTSFERQIESWEHLDKDGDFTVLPLLLVEGKKRFIDGLIDCFMDHYESHVLPLSFSTSDLGWMITMWSSCDGKKAPLLIEYSIPNENLDTIQYSLDEDTISLLWNRVHDANSDEVTADEVDRFMAAIETHFGTLFPLNLSAFKIANVTTSIAVVSTAGAIKIIEPDGIPHVLKHLTELAQDQKI